MVSVIISRRKKSELKQLCCKFDAIEATSISLYYLLLRKFGTDHSLVQLCSNLVNIATLKRNTFHDQLLFSFIIHYYIMFMPYFGFMQLCSDFFSLDTTWTQKVLS